ncbi:UDP-4-amino-4,6-dideoxy-N-acetyl-beta-L-altrosamine transaminase [Desmospora profundinema]|uniref:UDP-4-amino-4, 6-dideoxy-N-acetyl-beta-L-altrosamine transaminase n=1 Tax=Desmospora profundinema TaxID=1571184 RepID=A0ABU1IHS8_9BACL|nr:UDP-4-amino-4,6-dideoxy-N-acetyl-beta-L-altrosamine transaminase [Desmospora profundinema]MDR6224323.1 UDP-4-amino-4,6-dideoxy-N-acetyl-beta-L-altrosamine transaminase [Desmospora profundinema]
MSHTPSLAIYGGKPTRNTFLPYGKQWIEEDDIRAVVEVLKGDFITTGPAIQAFEKKLAQYVGARYAVAFSSGTAALHAACYVAGIRSGDDVITTPLTFAATANCILYQGARPIFADIDPVTYNMDPAELERKMTARTKAVIPVHFTGQPAKLDEIRRLAKKHGLVVIEDAAHALGASYKGRKIGGDGDLTMFSFHPVKHVTSGEGGAVTTNRRDYYEKLLQFRSHGITREPAKMREREGPWFYQMQFLGFNYRLTDIQAALGLSQMNKLDSFLRLRRKYASMYNHAFRNKKGVTVPFQPEDVQSAWHLYVLRLRLPELTTDRKTIFHALLKENIGVNVHYIPVHLHPYYRRLGYTEGLCPHAELFYREAITLPLFPKMSEEDAQDVIKAVNKVIQYYSVRGVNGGC